MVCIVIINVGVSLVVLNVSVVFSVHVFNSCLSLYNKSIQRLKFQVRINQISPSFDDIYEEGVNHKVINFPPVKDPVLLSLLLN